MEDDLVSAVLISYNKGKHIAETIDSVLAQTHKNWELIVADDGSTDESQQVIRDYAKKDPRIRYYFLNHGGVGRTVNIALSHCKGPYVAFLSSDDVSSPARFTKSLEAIKREKSEIVTSHAWYINDQSKVIEAPANIKAVFNHPNRSVSEILIYFVKFGNYLCAPAMMLTAALIKKLGTFLEPSMQLQDYEYWIRALEYSNVHIIQEPLVGYRLLSDHGNLSGSAATVRSYNEFYLIGDKLFDLCVEKIPERMLTEHTSALIQEPVLTPLQDSVKKLYLTYLLFLSTSRKEMQLIAFRKMHEHLQDYPEAEAPLFWQHVTLMNQFDIFSHLTYDKSKFFIRYRDGSYSVFTVPVQVSEEKQIVKIETDPGKYLYEIFWVPAIGLKVDTVLTGITTLNMEDKIQHSVRLNGTDFYPGAKHEHSFREKPLRLSGFKTGLTSVELTVAMRRVDLTESHTVSYVSVTLWQRVKFRIVMWLSKAKRRTGEG